MHQFFTDNPVLSQKMKSVLAKKAKIVLTSHQNPDGDAFGSGLSLWNLFRQMGHEVYFISPTDHPDFLSWMPGADSVINFESEQKDLALGLISSSDLIFCLDFSALNRIKEMADPVKNSNAIKVLIDHHQEPEFFTEFVYWDQTSAATCQLIYNLIQKLELSPFLNKEVAECLYTGILTDTGSFRFDATSPEIHKIAGELLAMGVEPNAVQRRLFDSNTFDRLRFLGFSLGEKLVYLPEFRVAYFSFTKEELEKFNSKSGDTDGIVNYGLSIKGVVLAALFVEREGLVKISFRSVGDFSASELSRKYFEGGGHKNAAGGRSGLSLEETVDKFLSLLPLYRNELQTQQI